MNIFIDESGSFDFKNTQSLTFSLVASILIPESHQSKLNIFFENYKASLPSSEKLNNEVKGSYLSINNRSKICKYLSKNPWIKATVYVTDNNVTTSTTINNWRKKQSEQFSKNKNLYIKAGGNAPLVLAHFDKIIKISKYNTRVSDNDYVEGLMLMQLIKTTLHKSTLCFITDKYKNDLGQFRFIIDRKLQTKLSRMEKYLFENIKGLLGFPPGIDKYGADVSRKMGMVTLSEWTNINHPFVRNFCTKEGINVNKIFEKGLEFEDSKKLNELQIIDIICNTVYASLTDPTNRELKQCFDLMATNLLFNHSEYNNLINIITLNLNHDGSEKSKLNKNSSIRYDPFYTINNINSYKKAGYRIPRRLVPKTAFEDPY